MSLPSKLTDALATIQEISELAFTNDLMIPLLKTFGYDRVEYFGGADEEGKDIVCWRTSEIGDVELTVVQVKKYKPSRRAYDSQSFHTIVNQLSQAIEKPIPFIDGSLYLPEIVYFATPFAVDTKVLQSRFEAYQSLRARRIRILDGPKVLELISLRLPEVFSTLSGARIQILEAMSSQLTNEVLMRALEFPYPRGVETFYTDIDFSLVRPGARLIFQSDLHPSEATYSLQREEWFRLSKLHASSSRIIGHSFIRDIERLEVMASEQEGTYAAWQLDHSKITDLYFGLAGERDRIEDLIKGEGMTGDIIVALASIDEFSFSETHRLAAERLGWKVFDERPKQEVNSPHIILPVTTDQVMAVDERTIKIAREYGRTLNDYIKNTTLYNESTERQPRFDILVTIDGANLARALREKREQIEHTVEEFNQRFPAVSELGAFLKECTQFFEIVRGILAEPKVAESVGIGKGRRETEVRLRISVHSVFDTRMSIALVGDAGAGKTTSLQMYAHKIRTTSDRLAIFAPLAALARSWRVSGGAAQPFEEGLRRYLGHLGVSISPEMLLDELNRSAGILLLDGVDEVATSLPWIVESVQSFAERAPNVQIVVSARSTAGYLEKLPFANISLLSFTPDQRDRFIAGWFVGKDDDHVLRIKTHLECSPEVADITKNPLLATILCVLAESNVPLPPSEVRLYDERLKLLLGHYDIQKQVSRIRTHSSHLYLAAKKIAFRLHLARERDEELGTIYDWAIKALLRVLPAEECRRAVDELIDPCGIFISSRDGERFGFGHLRYQEHLAAKEIAENRGIDIVPLMRDKWWIGAFVLYAQMNQDLEAIILRLAGADGVSSVMGALLAMVNTLPVDRKLHLERVVKQGGLLDDLIG